MAKKSKHIIPNAFDYFVGGVPPYQAFNNELHHIHEIVRVGEKTWSEGNPYLYSVWQLCFIGLACYFEAFCKDLFAALINIYPEILTRFCEKRGTIQVPVLEVYHLSQRFQYTIGSVVAEELNFGSAKSINSAYGDLIQVTPFSKDEAQWFSRFLNDRNLLVHHGGTFTFKYVGQRFQTRTIDDIHYQSLWIERQDLHDAIDKLNSIALKTNNACSRKFDVILKNNHIKITDSQKKAASYFNWTD
jgi:hypothetical protein